MIPYASYLRVYEPLAALPDAQARQWSAYVRRGPGPGVVAGTEAEHRAALAGLVTVPVRVVPGAESEHAFVHRLDGDTYVCPWRTRLRAWEALEDFCRGLPDELVEAFVPRPVLEQAQAEHERWAAAHPDVRSAIRTCTWTVPLPWFVLFDAQERRLLLGDRRGSAAERSAAPAVARSLRYLTAMANARRRLARALHVLRRTFEDGVAVSGLEDLGRWLEEFHPHALVELDYGGLVHLIDDEELSGDDSVLAVAEALTLLADGQPQQAAGVYERVVDRWRRVAALESAS